MKRRVDARCPQRLTACRSWSQPWPLAACARPIFFTWGEIFSLFPSTCTDTFGPKYAAADFSLLYTAKGTPAFLVPCANVLKTTMGIWHAAFMVAAASNLVIVLRALFVLQPLRGHQMRRTLLVEAPKADA